MSKPEPLVLSIDDDPCVGRVIQLKLEADGIRTIRTITAEDGLQTIREQHPDVVITDVKLPGLSGIELCRVLEPLQVARPFLVIVLTSRIDPESQIWVESSALRRFVSKPFSPRALAGIVRQHLDHSSPPDQTPCPGSQPSISGLD